MVSRNDASFRLVKDLTTNLWKPSSLARQPYERLTVFPDLYFSFAFMGTDFLNLPSGNLELFNGEYAPDEDEYVVSWRVVEENEIGASGKFVFRREYAWGCAEVITNLTTGGTMISRAEYVDVPNAINVPLLSKVNTESMGQRETTTVMRQIKANAAPSDRFTLEQFGLSEDLLGVNQSVTWDFPWYLVFLIVGISLLGVRFAISRRSR